MDHFTGFVIGENYVKTNYSGSDYDGGSVTVLARDERNRQGSFLDIMVGSICSHAQLGAVLFIFLFNPATQPSKHQPNRPS